jgi:3-dehydroquinate synthase
MPICYYVERHLSMQQTHGFSVPFKFPVHFTQDAWNRANTVFFDVVRREEADRRHRLLAVIDSEVASAHSWLSPDIRRYFAAFPDALELVAPPVIVPGGEAVKNDFSHPLDMLARINNVGLDRQSFVVAIGGGAVLDMVSFAAAIAHRGVRVIRFPTTVLSQADSGIAVKNGINLFGKKNFVGTFVPPFAVINDSRFLESLSQRDRISGVVEAIKVALLRDPGFYRYLEANIGNIVTGELSVLTSLVRRSAELHLAHICDNGDPFELGSARPLDFGHWAAHKLESMTHHRLRHGEAVAIGIALDVIYSVKKGHLAPLVADRILSLLEGVGFRLWDAALTERTPSGNLAIIQGLREFREHLGGELHVTLLRGIGQGFEVTEMDDAVVASAIDELEARGADAGERVEERIVSTAVFGRR